MRSIEFANFAYDDVQCRRTDRITVRASSAAVLAVKKQRTRVAVAAACAWPCVTLPKINAKDSLRAGQMLISQVIGNVHSALACPARLHPTVS